ncbi:MAG TPA: FliM/FliN family flagellar motor switch protein, partial [Pyrinomonadaceae bacterium]|nr:FliM/FliN family flagellar motor switch protein [Pyrinomonadaceae bacterium]
MATSNHLTEAENAAHPQGVPVDPFAVDFFGGTNAASDENESYIETEPINRKRIKPRKKSDWYKNLPRITNSEAELSYYFQNLPANLTEESSKIIAETLARYTFRESGNIKCSIVSAGEINLNETLNRLADTSRIFLNVSCQPENSSAIIALNNDFAKTLIDLILGGQCAEPGNLRELSPIEKTIVEFLAANVLGEFNNFLGEDLLYLQSLKSEPVDLFESFERGAEVVFSLELEDFKGLVSLFAPQKFLSGLDRSQNPLLVKKSDRKRLSDAEKIAGNLDLRLQIGTTFLDADSLLFLETDDIVLIEQPQISWGNAQFGGNLQICVGRGRNFRLQGIAENNDLSGGLNFRIEEILSGETRRKFTPAKFKMDEKENELAEETGFETDAPVGEESEEEVLEEQISPSLENVQVALRVEIAGNKISLRELQSLRAGQIIALGCSPTDPVRLVTDNNEEPVATG